MNALTEIEAALPPALANLSEAQLRAARCLVSGGIVALEQIERAGLTATAALLLDDGMVSLVVTPEEMEA